LAHSVPVGVRFRVCARVRWRHGLEMMAIASVLDDHRSCRECGRIGGPGWEGILSQIGRTQWIAPTPQTTAAAATGLQMTATITARIQVQKMPMLVRLNKRVMSHQHLFARSPDTTAAAAVGLKMIATISTMT
jgi:hypothetical protein